MIVLVWSLVSSVVEAARRRRLATFLRHFYDDPGNRKNMLVCKRNRQMDSFLSPSSSSARLTRFTSEPHLHTQQLIYRTERAELAVEQATVSFPKSVWSQDSLKVRVLSLSCLFRVSLSTVLTCPSVLPSLSNCLILILIMPPCQYVKSACLNLFTSGVLCL